MHKIIKKTDKEIADTIAGIPEYYQAKTKAEREGLGLFEASLSFQAKSSYIRSLSRDQVEALVAQESEHMRAGILIEFEYNYPDLLENIKWAYFNCSDKEIMELRVVGYQLLSSLGEGEPK